MSMQVINQDHYVPGVEKAAMWCEQEDVEDDPDDLYTGRSIALSPSVLIRRSYENYSSSLVRVVAKRFFTSAIH